MKGHLRCWVLVTALLGLAAIARAQVHYSGSLKSSLYARQNDSGTQKFDFYQGVGLKLTPEAMPNLYVKTYFQVADDPAHAGWDTKFYNGYINYRSGSKRFGFRLGRQFLYSGVMRGTFDGLALTINAFKNLRLRALAGGAAPGDRHVDSGYFNDHFAAGFSADYFLSRALALQASYFQRASEGTTTWQQAGLNASGNILEHLYYQTDAEFNLKESELQRLRLHIDYELGNLTVFTALSSARPRIYEESIFTSFRLDGYNQALLGGRYALNNEYQLAVRYLYTIYAGNDAAGQLIASADSRWGNLGVLFQHGDAGESSGVFGSLHYSPWHGLKLFASSSYYKYQRHLIVISEEATAFSAGGELEFGDDLVIRSEAQQRLNNTYTNDWRGLFSLRYRFARK